MGNVRNSFLFFIAFIVLNSKAFPQSKTKIRVMFYNVQNLFDIVNDPSTSDDDFTPNGRLKWTNTKYNSKLVNIYKVIAGVGEIQPPEIIGLCEIENWKVLHDLITLTPLSKYRYEIIHRDSPDPRGIDVALLCRSDIVKSFESKAISVSIPGKTYEYKTRDILMAKLLIANTDTVITFVNHWPSRRRGEFESAQSRLIAAKTLKREVDLVFTRNNNAKVIILGDLNDEPNNESLINGLKANTTFDKLYNNKLYNLSVLYSSKNKTGTLKFRGKWLIFDQIIVSGNILSSSKGLYTTKNNASIYNAEFIFQKDINYLGEKPYSTYNGFKYAGGYSDHLPVFIDLFSCK